MNWNKRQVLTQQLRIRDINRTAYIAGLSCIAFGLAASTVMMSIGQFALGFAVFLTPQIFQNLKRISRNPFALMWLGFFVLHLISGFHSANSSYFWNDIRTKIPLFSFPLAVAALGAPYKKELRIILYSFFASVLISAFWAFKIYLFESSALVIDYRDLSPLVSHIRMGLFLILAIFICLPICYEMFLKKNFSSLIAHIVLCLVFIFYLVILKSSTVIPVIGACLIGLAIYILVKKANRKISIALIFIFLGLLVYLGYRIRVISDMITQTETIIPENLPVITKNGNLYEHYLHRSQFENGHAVWVNICSAELRELWNKKSALDYDGKDKKGHRLDGTLIRYMSSKGLNKDAEGFAQLSETDIHNVENGVANYLYEGKFNIDGRIHETLWELHAYGEDADPNGRSMSQRIELWKASANLIQLNPLCGIGSGDVRDGLKKSLSSMNSKLRYFRQFGPHNQYLCTAIALGLPALLWLLACLLVPIFLNHFSYNYFIILCIAAVALINEDMFETQAAITFIMLFVSIFQKTDTIEMTEELNLQNRNQPRT